MSARQQRSAVQADAAVGSAPWLSADAGCWAAVLALAGLGAALRLAAARGELWGDELWSLALVRDVGSADRIFWGISHDNNHVLNSLWLFLAGPGRSALVYRAPSLLFGTASILVAALIGFRHGRATGLATAALVASCYPFVDYGSEARGYAGLILAILIATGAFERSLDRRLDAIGAGGTAPPARPDASSWIAGGAVAFGAMCHLTMLLALSVFGVAAVVRLRSAGRPAAALPDEAMALFRPALICLSPVVAATAAGLIVKGGLSIGGTVPFSVTGFSEGFGGLLRSLAGLPIGVPSWLVAATVLGLAAAAARAGVMSRGDAGLALGALVVVPGTMLAAHLANTEQPRYYLSMGTILMLLAARWFGALWQRGGVPRALATGLLAAILVGQVGPVRTLIARGRGDIRTMLAAMGPGFPLYATNFEQPVSLALAYYGPQEGNMPILAHLSDPVDFCDRSPRWYVHDSDPGDPPPAAHLRLGPLACRAGFTRIADYPVADLSGRHLTLYRREP